MPDSLIEQVRKAAEAQKKADLSAGKAAHDLTEADAAALDKYWEELVKLDFPALLAHMQAQQAMVTEAREERVEAAKRLSKQAARWLDDFIADSELIDAINGELADALEKLRSDNDGK